MVWIAVVDRVGRRPGRPRESNRPLEKLVRRPAERGSPAGSQMERQRFVEQLLARDEEAWRRFVTDHGRLIYAVAARLGLDEIDRDDLLQETCLTALRSIQTLESPARLASWVYTVAYRIGIDLLRRRRPEILVDQVGESFERSGTPNREPAFVTDLERLESVAQLLDALALLDPRCRRLLTALYIEDPRPSYAEISQRESIPIGSIGPTRARCLEKAEKSLRGLSNPTPRPSQGWSGPPEGSPPETDEH
jgi:RNA polymerase sigma factor (sigma-70 family)